MPLNAKFRLLCQCVLVLEFASYSSFCFSLAWQKIIKDRGIIQLCVVASSESNLLVHVCNTFRWKTICTQNERLLGKELAKIDMKFEIGFVRIKPTKVFARNLSHAAKCRRQLNQIQIQFPSPTLHTIQMMKRQKQHESMPYHLKKSDLAVILKHE